MGWFDRRHRARRSAPPTSIAPFAADDEQLATLRVEMNSDLERLFHAHEGRPVLKWAHYLPHYSRHFDRFRGTDVGMLEIGVFRGGSLDLWREYFGPQARIIGIDIDPECAERVTPPNRVLIGSQDDPLFLASAAAELGRLDIVLDDGSHFGSHQRASFERLFPLLADGGVYVIEDLHTSYWPDYHGGLGEPTSGIGLVRDVIDALHGWYHDADDALDLKHWVPAVHVYDSMVFIEKASRERPLVVTAGSDPSAGRPLF